MGAWPKKIGLFGLFGSGNIGNDGSLEAMLAFLRAQEIDSDLLCICADPERVQREFGLPAIRIGGRSAIHPLLRWVEKVTPLRKLLQLLHAFRSVRGLDVMIMPGTGILDDFSERFWGAPASLFAWCLAARLQGTKIAYVCVGAGPISHGISRRLMKGAARMAMYRSYRDQLSKNFMLSIGLDTQHDPVYPDIAFGLPKPDASKPGSAERPTIGLGVMTYFGWRGDAERGAAIYDTYIGKTTRFATWLLDQNYRVRLLMGEGTDQQAIDDVIAALSKAHPNLPRERIVAEPVNSLHELMRQISETQAVVATRFHNIVCALKLNKPTISLGYAKKNDVLMSTFGLGDFCQHVESFDVAVLIDQFKRLMAKQAIYEQQMRATNTEFLRALAHQEQVLLEKILGRDT
jgi:polysaccharide pyruvyl transferase WcaK-like protein